MSKYAIDSFVLTRLVQVLHSRRGLKNLQEFSAYYRNGNDEHAICWRFDCGF